MPRARIQLTTAELATIVAQRDDLRQRHPLDLHERRERHEPFVVEFVRLVYAATGRWFGASTYRKLIDALINTHDYKRSPALDTIHRVVQKLKKAEAELSVLVAATDNHPVAAINALQAVIRDAVAMSVKGLLHKRDETLQRQLDYLLAQVQSAEQAQHRASEEAAQLRNLLAMAEGALQAERGHAAESTTALRAEFEVVKAELRRLTETQDTANKRLLLAIDQVRSTERAQAQLIEQLRKQLAIAERDREFFAQRAYKAGSSIPPRLIE